MKRYELSHQKNIRDLGGLIGHDGKTIKYGLLYRGGLFDKVSDEDIEILKSFHLTDVVDFRSSDEYLERPDYHLEGVRHHNFPTFQSDLKKEEKKLDDGNLLWFIDKGNTGFTHLKKTYADVVDSLEGQEAYRKFFEVIMREHSVTYFHCSQGKDRAGIAAYLVEGVLGVSLDQIKEDYLLSNIAMEKRADKLLKSVKNKPFFDEDYHQSLIDVFSAKLEYLQMAIDVIDEKYGGVEKYVQDILKVDIDKLRKIYLE